MYILILYNGESILNNIVIPFFIFTYTLQKQYFTPKLGILRYLIIYYTIYRCVFLFSPPPPRDPNIIIHGYLTTTLPPLTLGASLPPSRGPG